ncbi:oxygen-insensitive NADPH nitroreductase [Streptococcus pneumoniae]|nr:oxygen-insensitive NADPH nitroreductase [Streptococcus pneumoniae]
MIVVRSQEKKDALYELVPQEAIRQSAVSEEVAELFNLPDYTYSVFGMALGVPNQHHDMKPRLPLENVVFEEEYQEQSTEAIQAYDRVQADYAGARATTSWSQRLAEQFGQAEPSSTRKNLEQKKLL